MGSGSLFLSIILGVLLLNTIIRASPQNGDIRLADGSEIRGRLEVYNSSTGTWGTVCYDSNNYQYWEKGAARAACRQLGYEDLVNVDTVTAFDLPLAPASTPIVLYSLNCPYNKVDDLNNEAEHILRCTFDVSGNCTHSQDMAIECTGTFKNSTPYDSEVQLVRGGTGYPSSGILEIYLNNFWGTVCADYVSKANADTVCRQMGYTGSSSHSSVSVDTVSELQPFLKKLTCSVPHPCLSQCFSYPQLTDNITCGFGRIAIINCTFNISLGMFTPGSESLCEVSAPVSPISIKLGEIIGGVVGSIILVTIAIIVLVLCCCFVSGCPLHSCRERRLYGYNQIQ